MVDFYLVLVYVLGYIGLVATSFYIINIFLHHRGKEEPKESDDKTVSIVIPAYNEEESIERTIKSALSLHYARERLEIIVVNDGSKDRTYEIAKRFESEGKHRVRVFTKENGGKGSALNFGIEKASGEIIVSMDADTFVRADALKIMIGYFADEAVQAVAPSMGVYKPKGILARIIQIEYYMGVFLRKSFAVVNAIHITPGAFSAYRKSFFEKHGGYDENNITEDLEIALRIQRNHGVLENAVQAVVYTLSPGTFRSLLVQRRRWYVGLVRNLWAYRDLFSRSHGALGTIILPTAVTTVLLSVILTLYVVMKALLDIKIELISLNSVNFEFNNAYEINSFIFERFFFTIFSHPLFLMAIIFMALLGFYLYFSRKNLRYEEGIKFSYVLFLLFYSFLFSFWWIVSFIYVIFNRKVVWREGSGKK